MSSGLYECFATRRGEGTPWLRRQIEQKVLMTFHKHPLVFALVAGALSATNAQAQPAPAKPAPQPPAAPTAAPPPVAPSAAPPAAPSTPPPAPAPAAPAPAAPPAHPPAAGTAPTAPPTTETPPPAGTSATAPPIAPVEPIAPGEPQAPLTEPLPAAPGEVGAGVRADAQVGGQVPPPQPERPPPAPLIPVVLEEEPPPPQPSVTPLHVDGSFWTRYEVRENYERYSSLTHPRFHREGDRFVYRARLGLETNPVGVGRGQAVLVRFSPQAYGTHSTGNAPPTVGDGYDLGVYEAFVRLTSRELDLDVGRFRMNYGEAALIGDLDWNEAGRAFQGGRIRFKGRSGYYTDVFATLISEGADTTGAVFEGDRYFYGIYTAMGPLIGDIDVDAYILSQTWGSVAGDPALGTTDQEGASFFTLGARVKQQIDKFDYRAEAGVQLGTTPVAGGDALDKFAYQADVGVGFTPVRQFRIGVGGLVASGDDDATDTKSNSWDPLFPTGHKFLGLTDVFGDRTNAVSGNLDVRYQPIHDLILQVQGHALARMQEDNGSGDKYTGTEVDTHVIHPIGQGAKLRAMYGIFVPANGYWGRNEPIHYLEAQFGYDF